MQLRIFTEPQQGADYQTLLRMAQATEELGFDAFFRSDHFLKMDHGGGPPAACPVRPTPGSPWPGWPSRPAASGSAR